MQFRKLIAWQASMDLAEAVYVQTQAFPKDETFGLKSQMRRAAVSIAANIAEGQGRNHRKEFLQFLGIACGSFAELETYVELSRRMGMLAPDAEFDGLMDRAGKLLFMLRKSKATVEPARES